jgi:hypothetical protein
VTNGYGYRHVKRKKKAAVKPAKRKKARFPSKKRRTKK